MTTIHVNLHIRRIILALSIIGAAGLSLPASAIDLSVTELFDPAIAVIPDIDGSGIMYQDFREGKYKFISRDLTATEEVIRDNGPAYMHPFDFGGNLLAWIEYKTTYGGMSKRGIDTPVPADGDYYVKVLEVSGGSETHATSDVGYKECIAADGIDVVWTDYRHYSASDTTIELYYYDGGSESRLTNQQGYKAAPMVRDNAMVWQDYRNATSNQSNADIFYATLPGVQEEEICTEGSYQAQPCLYGDIIVWQDYRNADGGDNADIYMYDRSSNDVTEVCTDASYQAHPKVYGDYIVWHDYRNVSGSDPENADIYLYEISTQDEQEVTTKAGYQAPPYLYGNNIVWYDYEDGKVYRAEIGGTSARQASWPSVGARRNAPQPDAIYDFRGRKLKRMRAKGLVLMKNPAGTVKRRLIREAQNLWNLE
ncbi:MAG: hypothetical protein GF418_14415 [Chitinivibrionales bacterium]|nr:hypothetical protein [Chitinivibrionales bacterium]MBD3396814.1 hypothetical protein [Chitinivibrionales bacterium]